VTATTTTPDTAAPAGTDPPVPAGASQPAPAGTAQACKRPGCAGLIPPGTGRGRSRVFCSDDCARRYHNDARLPAPAGGGSGEADPLAALEQLLRQAGACARAAREQAAALEPARVRADIASAEAGRRRAEAAAVTAAAHQAEAEAETRALAEALEAARDDKTAAQAAARDAGETAARLTAELDQLRRDTAVKITAAGQAAREQTAAARAHAARCERERDDAVAAARDAAAETARARQAEAGTRAEAGRLRDDAARERDALSAGHAAQILARQALTDAERGRAERAEAQLETERADRRQLTSHLTASTQLPAPAAGKRNPHADA
jgi:hypothetical protein